MNKLLYIVLLAVLLNSCNSENATDCFQTAGKIVQKEFQLKRFDTITVYDKIEVIVKEAPVQKVVLESGKNLMVDISVVNANGNLVLKSENNCNLFREFNVTKVYVESPNLYKIKNCSGAPVSSDGVLTYETLNLISENSGNIGKYRVDGLFNVNVKNKRTNVVVNNLTTTTLKGTTDLLSINYANGDARFEGRDLKAEKVTVFHRGTNDIIVNPQQEINGQLKSTGDLILVNKPPIVEVKEFYKGKLIIE